METQTDTTKVTLPDGSVREFADGVTVAEVAASIGPGLARAAIAAKVDEQVVDLSCRLHGQVSLAILKGDDTNPESLSVIRHSAAHVMAEAIGRVIPAVELVYGPPIDNGFYYDLALPDQRPLRTEDFAAIEAEMAKIIAENRPFTRYEKALDEGMTKLQAEGNKYKLDNARRAIGDGAERLSWYATGAPEKDWEDLCRGPHIPSTGRIGAFKILSLASSYWHGDASSDRLTRVYGTAFAEKKSLVKYLDQLEQARQRDHRVIGKQLQLFHIDEEVGQGLILWTPNGAVIRRELEEFIRGELRKQDYQFVYTPHIGKLDLYKTSGHFPYYRDSQYPPMIEADGMQALAQEGCSCAELSNRLKGGDVHGYLLKPMNCPHHIKVFASQPHSYRDLPVRLAEFGTVYRWEQSGEIGGMTRVRGFTQDDAHLFCTEAQLAQEIHGCLELVKIIFSTLQMDDYRVRVGVRDSGDSSKYVGSAENWDKAEQACRDAASGLGVPFVEEAGEAAFYGPKIDFVVHDVLDREWQLGTIQVDYNLPERFDLSYIGSDNQSHRPVMIHRAPFGSLERFVGVLIEHFAGAFPLWLAPEQVRVLPISEKYNGYAQQLRDRLKGAGLRVTVDDADDKIGAKIRRGRLNHLPYMAVVGEKEQADGAVAVNRAGTNLGSRAAEEFIAALKQEVDLRRPRAQNSK